MIDATASGALVTGGARGIGRAIAERLAADGATVFLTDADETAAVSAAAELGGRGLDVRGLALDVRDPSAVREVVAVADGETALSTVVNNAGVAWSKPLVDTDVAAFDELMAVNLRGTFLVLQAAARAMIPRGRGTIVNIASTSAFTASTSPMAAYDTSKGAVRALTVTAARELASHGIRVNAVAPGTVDTDLMRGLIEDPEILRLQAHDLIPLGRLGRPEDVAAAVSFLSSEGAGYITGHTLVVDGGWLT